MINEELLVEILNDYTYPDTVDGDMFYYTMYTDYRDEIGDDVLSQISISDNPRECFEESLMDAYVDAEGYDFNRLCDTIKEHYPDYNADMEDEIRDWLTDHTCSTIDWEHFFLAEMTLGEFIQLREKMLKDKKANDSYEYEERKGTEKFSISKHCMCGLYDVWNGGGSVLEIELEKDVKLTTKELFDVWIDCRGCKANGRGYDVDDVYGLCGSAWVEGIELG